MTTNKTSLILALLAVVLIAQFGLQAKVQHEKSNQPFVNIPTEFHPQLRKRLKLFITFQSKRQWGKMYDLSIERLERRDLTKGEFITSHLEVETGPSVSTLIGFVPESAVHTNEYGNVKEWTIDGCAKYLRNGKVVYLKAGLVAALNNSQWYFSYLSTTTDAVDGPERSCKPGG
jgi:hypothetical protein